MTNFRSLERGVARVEKKRLKPKPDKAGMTPHERLMWAAENGKFEELVAKNCRDNPPLKMITPEEREVALRAEGKWPQPESADEPQGTPIDAEPTSPPEPQPEPQWWEEKAHWRLRGPADHYVDSKPNECIHEYDPLTYDDRDYDEEEE